MALHLVSKSGTARIAVVGAESLCGAQLREALAESRVPGSRVNLYGVADGEAVISEYAGEARLIQDPDLREIVAHEIIYLCEAGKLAADVIAAAGRASTVIDLIGCLPADVDTRLVHPDVNPSVLEDHSGYLSVPQPLSVTLAELLHGVEQIHGVEQAEVTVLRPASDFGESGIEELRAQTVALLSFADVRAEVFGGQLAFNTLSEPAPAGHEPPLETLVPEETQRLLGWEQQRLALRVMTIPVFYGHGVQLHLRTRSPATLEELGQTLRSSAFFGPPVPAREATPLEVASAGTIVVAQPTEDGLGGFWIWAVAGEVALRSARLAVKLSDLSGPTEGSR